MPILTIALCTENKNKNNVTTTVADTNTTTHAHETTTKTRPIIVVIQRGIIPNLFVFGLIVGSVGFLILFVVSAVSVRLLTVSNTEQLVRKVCR